MKGPSPRALLEALADLVSTTPEEVTPHGVRCHYCLAGAGREHHDGCAWVEASVLVLGDAAPRRQQVGEDDEDLLDRLEDEQDEDASDARAAVAEALDLPLPDMPEEVLEPLDPTLFDPQDDPEPEKS
jgi:hypothetical protein